MPKGINSNIPPPPQRNIQISVTTQQYSFNYFFPPKKSSFQNTLNKATPTKNHKKQYLWRLFCLQHRSAHWSWAMEYLVTLNAKYGGFIARLSSLLCTPNGSLLARDDHLEHKIH